MPDHIDYMPEHVHWRRRVAQEVRRETPFQWAQRLLMYAEELADIEPMMAQTMRVCGVLLEQAPFYSSIDMRHRVTASQERLVEDGLFVVRALIEQGSQEEARGALEAVKQMAGVPTAPSAMPATKPKVEPEVAKAQRPKAAPANQAAPLVNQLRQTGFAIRSFPES